MFEWMGASSLPFPWCVVMFFNGDSLCTFSYVCAFLLLLIPAPRGAILAGGPCWRTNMWIVSVLFFSSPLFPSLSLSQWCVQKRKSSSSVHLMVSTSRKLPAIRASAILMPCTLGLCSSPYIACPCRGVVAGGIIVHWKIHVLTKRPCDCLAPGQSDSSHFVQKINCWQCSLTLPAPSVKRKEAVVLLGSAEQARALPGHGALSFCYRGAKKRSRCFACCWCRHPWWEPCTVELTGSHSKCGRDWWGSTVEMKCVGTAPPGSSELPATSFFSILTEKVCQSLYNPKLPFVLISFMYPSMTKYPVTASPVLFISFFHPYRCLISIKFVRKVVKPTLNRAKRKLAGAIL